LRIQDANRENEEQGTCLRQKSAYVIKRHKNRGMWGAKGFMIEKRRNGRHSYTEDNEKKQKHGGGKERDLTPIGKGAQKQAVKKREHKQKKIYQRKG